MTSSLPLSPLCKIRTALDNYSARVRVRNLQTTVVGPADAWGRQMMPQPMLVSASVTLRQHPTSTAADDALGTDAVHYGLLSKAIKASVEKPCPEQAPSLDLVLARLWADLCGSHAGGHQDANQPKPLIHPNTVACLELMASLPKASLRGEAVSLTIVGLFAHPGTRIGPTMHARTLRLDSLKMPLVIGLNDNERKAQQLVSVSIQIDMLDDLSDIYTPLETQLVKEASSLSPKTLESLVDSLTHIVSRFVTRQWHDIPNSGPNITVMVEKPTAVPFAEAPCFELTVNARDVYLSHQTRRV
ncbi:hypothetical protein CDD82_7241 [Ophiocordyceps australis]|uniref:Dihydroneopterin aldolase/epimerase domain-containing protein n=1 Tax=Ophiocordyceps australis TaxID=1399860 RepID=A0A2C5YL74_9HYPO|nr:hypothetical protein CDD82_7241 [Ophiocordyceps australis]